MNSSAAARGTLRDWVVLHGPRQQRALDRQSDHVLRLVALTFAPAAFRGFERGEQSLQTSAGRRDRACSSFAVPIDSSKSSSVFYHVHVERIACHGAVCIQFDGGDIKIYAGEVIEENLRRRAALKPSKSLDIAETALGGIYYPARAAFLRDQRCKLIMIGYTAIGTRQTNALAALRRGRSESTDSLNSAHFNNAGHAPQTGQYPSIQPADLEDAQAAVAGMEERGWVGVQRLPGMLRDPRRAQRGSSYGFILLAQKL